MFLTDLGGSVYSANLNGLDRHYSTIKGTSPALHMLNCPSNIE